MINCDICHNCSVDGFDIFLHQNLMRQKLDINYYPQLTGLSLFSDKPKSLPSYNRKRKYMFQRVNFGIDNDISENKLYVNDVFHHPIL